MASYYVRSLAAGTGTGANWANAFTSLANAIALPIAAGDTLYISEDHAETTAGALTLTFPGTVPLPNLILCVDHTGSVPPVSADLRTTATVSNTTAAAMALQGSFYCYGIIFQCGSTAGTATMSIANLSGSAQVYQSCQHALLSTGASSKLVLGGVGLNRINFINTAVKFSAVGQSIAENSGDFIWQNTASAIVGSIPTNLFNTNTNVGVSMNLLMEGVDFSAVGAGKTLVNTGANTGPKHYVFKDCQFNAALTSIATINASSLAIVDVIRSDSSGTNYRCEQYTNHGVETTETTIVRTGGATDGATPQSRKLVTTSTSSWGYTYDAMPLSIWNNVSGSPINVDIYGTWGGGAVPINTDIWFEVEYPGSSSTPQGSRATCGTADILTTGTNLNTDTSTWGGGTTPFRMRCTFTPQMVGPLSIYVRAAKVSTTFYIDPCPVLS